jgi:hypothetical protein
MLETKKPNDEILLPASIADTYWHLHSQPRNAWTLDLDLRPWCVPSRCSCVTHRSPVATSEHTIGSQPRSHGRRRMANATDCPHSTCSSPGLPGRRTEKAWFNS